MKKDSTNEQTKNKRQTKNKKQNKTNQKKTKKNNQPTENFSDLISSPFSLMLTSLANFRLLAEVVPPLVTMMKETVGSAKASFPEAVDITTVVSCVFACSFQK